MTTRIPTKKEIQTATERYLRSVTADPKKAPIRDIITEIFREIIPEGPLQEEEITQVMTHLSESTLTLMARSVVAAKKIFESNAKEDLEQFVGQFLKQLKPRGFTVTDKDVAAVITQGALNPYSSTIPEIKKAAADYFTQPRKVKNVSPEEIKKAIHQELEKYGPVDGRMVNRIFQEYSNKANSEEAYNPEDLKAIIKSTLPIVVEPKKQPDAPTQGPQPTQIIRPPEKVEKPDEDGEIRALPPRSSDDEDQDEEKVTAGKFVPPADAKNKSFFEKIRYKMRRYGLRPLTQNARSWLLDTVRKVDKQPSQSTLFKRGRVVRTMEEAFVGKMFLYAYDAKWKSTLPYWDAFPLIFVVDLYDDGWLGINLHYLPMTLRLKLFDALLSFADDTTLDNITRLKMSYATLKAFSQFPLVRPCLKRYLVSHVESSMLTVEAVDWETAVFLPVEEFQKQPIQRVFRDSRAKAQKYKARNKKIA